MLLFNYHHALFTATCMVLQRGDFTRAESSLESSLKAC